MRAVLRAALLVFLLTAGALPSCGKLSWRSNLAALRATASWAETDQRNSVDGAEVGTHGASSGKSKFKRFSSRARRQFSKTNSSDLAPSGCFWKKLKKGGLCKFCTTGYL
jgi:hypothetical protein